MCEADEITPPYDEITRFDGTVLLKDLRLILCKYRSLHFDLKTILIPPPLLKNILFPLLMTRHCTTPIDYKYAPESFENTWVKNNTRDMDYDL